MVSIIERQNWQHPFSNVRCSDVFLLYYIPHHNRINLAGLRHVAAFPWVKYNYIALRLTHLWDTCCGI